jgi:glycosyltransferase involved in cell wall biosynthesis
MRLCLAHGGDVSQPSGGTDRVTALAGGLAERGHEVSLVVPKPGEGLPDRLADVAVEPVATSSVDSAPTRALAVTGRARRVAAERDALLQLEHSSLAGVGTLRGCANYVLDMHDVAYPRFDHVDTRAAPVLKRGMRWLERRAVSRARHVVVVSERMADMLRSGWDVTHDQLTVVPNGYFPERLRGLADVEPIDGRVAFLGTLHPKVDVDTLEAVADLSAVTELVVVGDGAQRERVDRLADRHPAVRATGRLPDAAAFKELARAAVVINPQATSALQRSSSPVKLYYYAALGRPMVVTEGPSVVDELVGRDAARAAESREAFVSHVQELLRSSARRAEIGTNAQTAAETFTWEHRTSQLLDVYETRLGVVAP